jgi:hypothetical protein
MALRFAWVVLAATLVAPGQDRAAADVHVALSLRNGKTTFRMGEPIRLILSFTADRSGYAVDTTTTNPASPIDEVVVSPETGVFPWLDIYSAPNRYSPDYSSLSKLSTTPTDVVIALNQWVRFDLPGEYTVRITTRRLRPDTPPFYSGRGTPLVTNVISFRIERMSEAEEQAEIQRVGALLDATPKSNHEALTEYCEDLAFLAGDAGAREKVRRYFLLEGQISGNCRGALSMGFYISRSSQPILAVLEGRLRDLTVPASTDVINLASEMRFWEQAPGVYAEARGDMQLLWRLKKERSAGIREAYIAEVVESLGVRVGASRRTTAETIASIGTPLSQSSAAVKILKAEFDQLSVDEQRWLVQARWKELRDPALVPALKRLASTVSASSRTPFLGALLDVAPDDVRPFFVAAMLDSPYVSDFDVLRRLPQPTLPELDAPLLSQLQELAATRRPRDASVFELRSALAARYATAAIQSGVLNILDQFGGELATEPKANLLAYLSKWNEAAARPLVEQAVATSRDANWLLYKLTEFCYPTWVDQLMRDRLESDDPQTASEAASRMSALGPAEDLNFLQARLNRWLSNWSGRDTELEPADTGYSPQANLQVALIRAILGGRSWKGKVTDAQAAALKQTCLSESCRKAFAVR